MNPLQRWRRLSGGAKLIAFARLSIQGMVLVLGGQMVFLGIVVGVGRGGGQFGTDAEREPWLFMVGAGVAVALTIVGIAISEYRPEFNVVSRRDVGYLVPVAVVLSGATWVSGIVLYLSANDAQAAAGLYLIVLTSCLAPLSSLAWIPRRWVVTLLLSVVTAWITWDKLHLWLIFPVFFLWAVVLSEWMVRIARQLEQARRTESALHVSEERLRFAQELHDTLGQRLAAMSVKTELARALAARDDERLDAELGELQLLIRVSVRDMHDVVDGYRTIELSVELEGSREFLAGSGIQVTIHGDATIVRDSLREISAWLVREATTNVVKHSDATWVEMTLAPDGLSIVNDGAHQPLGSLSGLEGLRRRATLSGADISLDHRGDLFTVTLSTGGAS